MPIEYFKNGGMSFADFIASCDNTVFFATRDIIELGTCGVTQEKVDDLKLSAFNLLDNKSHVIMSAQKKLKTKNRDNVFEFVSDKLAITKKQLAPVFSKLDSNYDTLFTKPHFHIKPKQFLVYCNDILTVLKENKALLLATTEFNEANIAAFENDIASLNQAEREREQAEISFNNDTLECSLAREATYNKLYFIASMGKVYWKKKNPAKSQDYILKRRKTSKAKTNEDVELEIDNTNIPFNTEDTQNTGE